MCGDCPYNDGLFLHPMLVRYVCWFLFVDSRCHCTSGVQCLGQFVVSSTPSVPKHMVVG